METDQTLPQNLIAVDYNPFEIEREIDKIIVINESQREIWLSCLIGGVEANLAYNESVTLAFKGDFSLPNFKKALSTVVHRHEALRSTVSANGAHFIIYKALAFELVYHDLSNETDEEQEHTISNFLKSQMLQPFDLVNEPLFRFYLHKKDEHEYFFTLVIHHIIGDGWSIGIILENLSKAYNAYQNNEEPTLPPVNQISSYAKEQFNYLQGEQFKATEQFWLKKFAGPIPSLNLPTDFERGKSRTYQANRIDHKLDSALVKQIKLAGAKAGCSLVNTMLGLFEVFLSQITHQSDIVVGLPAAGQLATANYELVGHCVNIIPIRSKIDGSHTLLSYLKESKTSFLDAYEHQQLSFGQLLKKLNFKRDPARIPLVPVVFNIDMGMDQAVEFNGLALELGSAHRAYETFELFLNATGSQETLILEWNYNTQLFKESTIKHWVTDFEKLLQDFVKNPESAVEFAATNSELKLPIQQQVTRNYTGGDIVAIINESCVANKSKTAVKFKNETLTYQQLLEKSNQLAQILVKNGVGSGDIVALSTDRSIHMVVMLLGILKAGAAYLPLDPSYPKDRIEFMLADAGAKLLLLNKKYAHQFNASQNELYIENIWQELAQEALHFTININLKQISNIIYTSGTTGKPKGTKTTHKNLANLITSIKNQPGVKTADKFLALTTISFDIAAVEIFLPLLAGATVVIATAEDGKDGRLLLELIEKENITILQATPSRWKMLLSAGWEKQYPITAFTAGEALTKQLAHQILQKTKALWNLYGPTETTIYSTIKQVSITDELITIGKPVNNTAIYILDEHQKQLPVNTIGEIFIAGEGVADGYLNRPELTAEKFIFDPFSDVEGQKMYGTGDLGKYLPNGEIQCLGRIDHQVKIRGYRIELEEIEAALAKQPDVKQVVVTAKTDLNEQQRLVAYLILNHNKKINDNEPSIIDKKITNHWKTALNELLPSFMIPDQYIALTEFPLTPNGKIDRNKLPYPTIKTENDDDHQPTLSKNELLVANIWSKVLKLENLKPDDDFFEIGGHSLLAVSVMMEIEQQTKRKLPLATLFENSTIRSLAKMLIVDEKEIKWNSLVPIKKTGNKIPIYLIHGAGLNVLIFNLLSKYVDKEQPVYGMQAIGLDEDREFGYTMEELADIYLAEILAHNPTGPYALAGYSFGGLLAYEMAGKLMQMGKEIKMLGLLDTNATGKELYKSKADELMKKFTRQIHKPLFFSKSFIEYPLETISYQFNGISTRFNKFFNINNKTPDDVLSNKEKLSKSYDIAYNNYKLKPLPIHVDLFRVKKRLYFLDDLKYLGWNSYAKKGVSVHEVPGDHKTFLFEPNVKMFAEILQRTLNQK
ncbi:non-ribosomal peptide synthetase [Pedobacter cryotolerans]|uniref:Amino acid adenylation domain-containing protein n=1 Tax=Pedobacter cryotolerans TaxID=2571270 RepID=A0A4U1C841_9SPHI|nr:non-ribosomal peptide synthetase [Pedobacter cryotolerans]TKB99644.1 amino acid adenylation domain-containing protein [Pedobacter cryotolerans]